MGRGAYCSAPSLCDCRHMQKIMLIALAGAVGTLSRYGLGVLVNRLVSHPFPWATFTVNAVGCFLFGLIWQLAEQRVDFSVEARTIVLVGFMGAFTTFSTFIFDTHALMRGGQWLQLLLYLLGQNLVGVAAFVIGWSLAKLLYN
jgi:CrcB protein